MGPPLGLSLEQGNRGVFAARVTRWPSTYAHGKTTLGSVERISRDVWGLVARDAQVSGLDPLRAVYLDIETTGLSGGAGTKSFLVGLGHFSDGEFELWQGFLRGPEEEAAMLASCAERIAASAGVVSYFGKSFDRHRLEDKMRMHGIAAPFARLPHFDLYHACRRVYGGLWSDTRLATAEREICGVVREHDLPGSFAPAAWFDFLSGRPHLLEEVFRHNRDDVLSLVSLAARLGGLGGQAHAGEHDAPEALRRRAAECRALAEACARAKRWEESLEWAKRALELCTEAEPRREALELVSVALKACARTPERLAVLRELAHAARDERAARACLEWAADLGHGAPAEARAALELGAGIAGECSGPGIPALAARIDRRLHALSRAARSE